VARPASYFAPIATANVGPERPQTDLQIGAIDDPLEREADRVAEQVTRIPAPAPSPPPAARRAPPVARAAQRIQRMCSSCGEEVQRTPRLDAVARRAPRGAGSRQCQVQRAPALRVAPTSDPREREAERMADTVARMPATGGPTIRRKCTACEENAEQTAQRTAAMESDATHGPRFAEGGAASAEFASTMFSLRGGGEPLGDALQAYFEPRFGRDLSDVRLHSGARAQQACDAIDARAFTLGHDIVMGRGAPSVESSDGKRLLAHELTHVLQQTGPAVLAQRADDPSDAVSQRQAPQRQAETALREPDDAIPQETYDAFADAYAESHKLVAGIANAIAPGTMSMPISDKPEIVNYAGMFVDPDRGEFGTLLLSQKASSVSGRWYPIVPRGMFGYTLPVLGEGSFRGGVSDSGELTGTLAATVGGVAEHMPVFLHAPELGKPIELSWSLSAGKATLNGEPALSVELFNAEDFQVATLLAHTETPEPFAGRYGGGEQWGELLLFQSGTELWGTYLMPAPFSSNFLPDVPPDHGRIVLGVVQGDVAHAEYWEETRHGEARGTIELSKRQAEPNTLDVDWQNFRSVEPKDTTFTRIEPAQWRMVGVRHGDAGAEAREQLVTEQRKKQMLAYAAMAGEAAGPYLESLVEALSDAGFTDETWLVFERAAHARGTTYTALNALLYESNGAVVWSWWCEQAGLDDAEATAFRGLMGDDSFHDTVAFGQIRTLLHRSSLSLPERAEIVISLARDEKDEHGEVKEKAPATVWHEGVYDTTAIQKALDAEVAEIFEGLPASQMLTGIEPSTGPVNTIHDARERLDYWSTTSTLYPPILEDYYDTVIEWHTARAKEAKEKTRTGVFVSAEQWLRGTAEFEAARKAEARAPRALRAAAKTMTDRHKSLQGIYDDIAAAQFELDALSDLTEEITVDLYEHDTDATLLANFKERFTESLGAAKSKIESNKDFPADVADAFHKVAEIRGMESEIASIEAYLNRAYWDKVGTLVFEFFEFIVDTAVNFAECAWDNPALVAEATLEIGATVATGGAAGLVVAGRTGLKVADLIDNVGDAHEMLETVLLLGEQVSELDDLSAFFSADGVTTAVVAALFGNLPALPGLPAAAETGPSPCAKTGRRPKGLKCTLQYIMGVVAKLGGAYNVAREAVDLTKYPWFRKLAAASAFIVKAVQLGSELGDVEGDDVSQLGAHLLSAKDTLREKVVGPIGTISAALEDPAAVIADAVDALLGFALQKLLRSGPATLELGVTCLLNMSPDEMLEMVDPMGNLRRDLADGIDDLGFDKLRGPLVGWLAGANAWVNDFDSLIADAIKAFDDEYLSDTDKYVEFIGSLADTLYLSPAGATPALVRPSIAQVMAVSAGQPMASSVRRPMEGHFGADLSGVRIHNDVHASEASRSLNAHAMTLGSDIYFARGAYAPETQGGRRLLAHELTHVAQEQDGPSPGIGNPLVFRSAIGTTIAQETLHYGNLIGAWDNVITESLSAGQHKRWSAYLDGFWTRFKESDHVEAFFRPLVLQPKQLLAEYRRWLGSTATVKFKDTTAKAPWYDLTRDKAIGRAAAEEYARARSGEKPERQGITISAGALSVIVRAYAAASVARWLFHGVEPTTATKSSGHDTRDQPPTDAEVPVSFEQEVLEKKWTNEIKVWANTLATTAANTPQSLGENSERQLKTTVASGNIAIQLQYLPEERVRAFRDSTHNVDTRDPALWCVGAEDGRVEIAQSSEVEFRPAEYVDWVKKRGMVDEEDDKVVQGELREFRKEAANERVGLVTVGSTGSGVYIFVAPNELSKTTGDKTVGSCTGEMVDTAVRCIHAENVVCVLRAFAAKKGYVVSRTGCDNVCIEMYVDGKSIFDNGSNRRHIGRVLREAAGGGYDATEGGHQEWIPVARTGDLVADKIDQGDTADWICLQHVLRSPTYAVVYHPNRERLRDCGIWSLVNTSRKALSRNQAISGHAGALYATSTFGGESFTKRKELSAEPTYKGELADPKKDQAFGTVFDNLLENHPNKTQAELVGTIKKLAKEFLWKKEGHLQEIASDIALSKPSTNCLEDNLKEPKLKQEAIPEYAGTIPELPIGYKSSKGHDKSYPKLMDLDEAAKGYTVAVLDSLEWNKVKANVTKCTEGATNDCKTNECK
jgi:Domain of unknown function (DUF4157)